MGGYIGGGGRLDNLILTSVVECGMILSVLTVFSAIFLAIGYGW